MAMIMIMIIIMIIIIIIIIRSHFGSPTHRCRGPSEKSLLLHGWNLDIVLSVQGTFRKVPPPRRLISRYRTMGAGDLPKSPSFYTAGISISYYRCRGF